MNAHNARAALDAAQRKLDNAQADVAMLVTSVSAGHTDRVTIHRLEAAIARRDAALGRRDRAARAVAALAPPKREPTVLADGAYRQLCHNVAARRAAGQTVPDPDVIVVSGAAWRLVAALGAGDIASAITIAPSCEPRDREYVSDAIERTRLRVGLDIDAQCDLDRLAALVEGRDLDREERETREAARLDAIAATVPAVGMWGAK